MKNKIILLILFVLQISALLGQKSPTKAASADVIKFMNTITPSDLEAHLSFLASDELEGRATGERGQKLAAKYLASQFKKIGLKPSGEPKTENNYFQTYPLIEGKVSSISIHTGKKKYAFPQDFLSFSTTELAEPIEGGLVFAGHGISDENYDNFKGLDVKDKIVIILNSEPFDKEKISMVTNSSKLSPWSESRNKKRDFAQSKGAKAILIVMEQAQFDQISNSQYLKHLLGKTSLRLKENKAKKIPTIYISESMANNLFKESKTNVLEQKTKLITQEEPENLSFKKSPFYLNSESNFKEVLAENVLGLIEGTDKKDEIVILTAHYDHIGVEGDLIYNGADDDGSGTATLLEMAEAFQLASDAGFKPRRSILIMPVSGEERGLLGSQYYSENPVFPLEKTVCDLNIDMIGRVDKEHEEKGESLYVYIIGSDKLSSDLHEVNESMNSAYTKLDLDYTYNEPDDPNRFYYRSDHYNFAKNNIPVIFYFTGVHEDYHKPTDTIDKIDFDKMATIAKLVFVTAWEIANREEKLVVDKENDFSNDR